MLNSLEVIGLDAKESPHSFSFLTKEEIASKSFIRPNKPKIIFENDFFSVLYKPSGMPSAPLVENEPNTLLYFFLEKCSIARAVKGRKEIEAGLVHRLDTATSGLVLIAKTQRAYDFFLSLQNTHKIEKTYIAVSDIDKTKTSSKAIRSWNFPKKITSQFRPFGPKARMVAPVFPDNHRFVESGRLYETEIRSISKISDADSYIVECSLRKGYRHQIRSHLACLGLPIKCDALYNPMFSLKDAEILKNHSYPLELHAVGLSLLK